MSQDKVVSKLVRKYHVIVDMADGERKKRSPVDCTGVMI
jgi:hypothetical protein